MILKRNIKPLLVASTASLLVSSQCCLHSHQNIFITIVPSQAIFLIKRLSLSLSESLNFVTSPFCQTSQRRTVFCVEVNANGFTIPPSRDKMKDVTISPKVLRWCKRLCEEPIENGSEGVGVMMIDENELKTNLILIGAAGAGKMTNLLLAGEYLEKRGKSIAYVSGSVNRVHEMGGIYMFPFFGLRTDDSLPILEQMIGTFRRHTILMSTVYENIYPSLAYIDVLLFDTMDKATPDMIKALDIVCRQLRGAENVEKPFGGLRILANANFWRLRDACPSSDYGGYIFQTEEYQNWFDQYYCSRIYQQEDLLNELTFKALLGELTPGDVEMLENGGPLKIMTTDKKQKDENYENTNDDRHHNNSSFFEGAQINEKTKKTKRRKSSDYNHNSDKAGIAIPEGTTMPPTPMLDYFSTLSTLLPRFPRQSSSHEFAAKLFPVRRTEFGHFLANSIQHTLSFPEAYNLMERLTVDAGTPVHLNYAYGDIPAGELGVVEAINTFTNKNKSPRSIGDMILLNEGNNSTSTFSTTTGGTNTTSIVVNFPRLRKSATIYPIRFILYHPNYPEVVVKTSQFPLTNRSICCGYAILRYRHYYNVQIDGMYLTETNELGNVLARMRTFSDFKAVNISKYLKLEGIVHEATRAYVRHLLVSGKGDRKLIPRDEEWCRNCKTHVEPKTFYAHWISCLSKVRWCHACQKVIPFSKYESHLEKHQIVLCIDCTMPVEWKNWEQHRISCEPMLREISSDNSFLPERTRQVAMQAGFDKRDLHTVKVLTKGTLPKAKLPVAQTITPVVEEAVRKKVGPGMLESMFPKSAVFYGK